MCIILHKYDKLFSMKNIQIEFGNRIKELRIGYGISQEELASITGIKRENLSRVEAGKYNATLQTIEKFCKAFNMNPSQLLLFSDAQETETQKNESIIKPHPFVKWAGGKKQILEKLTAYIPSSFNTYFEPFIGGGALFLNLMPKSAVINDLNEELIDAYKCLQDDKKFNKLLEILKMHEEKHSEEYYYEVREMDRNTDFSSLTEPERAARMIYLNKACFNGLYRVNAKGFFNVPSGRKEKVKTFEKENMESIHNYFKKSKIKFLCTDFKESVKTAQKGDFVYFDPPYDTLEDKESFTSYAKDGFGKEQQKRLSEVFKELSNKEVSVMLSNHNTDYIKTLYKDFNIHVIEAKRMINSDPKGRGNVKEVIITNY